MSVLTVPALSSGYDTKILHTAVTCVKTSNEHSITAQKTAVHSKNFIKFAFSNSSFIFITQNAFNHKFESFCSVALYLYYTTAVLETATLIFYHTFEFQNFFTLLFYNLSPLDINCAFTNTFSSVLFSGLNLKLFRNFLNPVYGNFRRKLHNS